MSVHDEWARAESTLRDRAYATIEADPGFLPDHEGGPYGVKADIILARLIGHDDQIVRDDVRLDRIEPVWLEPIHERLTPAAPDDPYSPPRVAEYGLRSGYAVATLDATAIWPPPDVRPNGSPLYTVLFLRYKRRLTI